jgi:hypothetical protein
MCAIGEGRHLTTAVSSDEVAAFVDAVARYQGPNDAERWVGWLLDPKRSNQASGTIRMAGVPATGFADKKTFEAWWETHRRDITLDMQYLAAYPNDPPTTQPAAATQLEPHMDHP